MLPNRAALQVSSSGIVALVKADRRLVRMYSTLTQAHPISVLNRMRLPSRRDVAAADRA
jgi:hypothetical protein